MLRFSCRLFKNRIMNGSGSFNKLAARARCSENVQKHLNNLTCAGCGEAPTSCSGNSDPDLTSFEHVNLQTCKSDLSRCERSTLKVSVLLPSTKTQIPLIRCSRGSSSSSSSSSSQKYLIKSPKKPFMWVKPWFSNILIVSALFDLMRKELMDIESFNRSKLFPLQQKHVKYLTRGDECCLRAFKGKLKVFASRRHSTRTITVFVGWFCKLLWNEAKFVGKWFEIKTIWLLWWEVCLGMLLTLLTRPADVCVLQDVRWVKSAIGAVAEDSCEFHPQSQGGEVRGRAVQLLCDGQMKWEWDGVLR